MRDFMDADFLLESDTAKHLYHEYAAGLPIIDYHCHISPQEIAENRRFENITLLWLEGDHYKWRMMRWCGISEETITGRATDKEKFDAFAAALPQAAGNPLYHWTHLELQRYFGCTTSLNPKTANEIWHLCNQRLGEGMSARDIIRQSGVEIICTTDDPADSLEWHKQIALDNSFSTKVYPTFRPDKAMAIDKPGYAAYITGLGDVCGHPIKCMEDLYAALDSRLAFFVSRGCAVADHGLDAIPWRVDSDDLDGILGRALQGEAVSLDEAETFKTALLRFLGAEYSKHKVVMQLHYGTQRNVNPPMFTKLGADTGFDCIDTPNPAQNLAKLLGALAERNALPKTILYSLNPSDNAMLACLAGAFQREGTKGWVQHGSAWWFNDTKHGMEQQLTNLANVGVLGSFVGMLTDSRSFLSYTRHEYFRRILCNLMGRWVENGEYPNDAEFLGELVQNISHHNAARYFGWQ